ncbi:hypothetical protein KR009_002145 [Drosophila setifemur]|nr:hypothetical protein KR009_002145 [Drosophila setifemur]
MMPAKIRTHSFYLYSAALVLVWLAVIQLQVANALVTTSAPNTTQSPNAVTTSTPRKLNPLTEAKHERNCKALCEHCGCMGFYCGEECLCECNDDNSDTECIRTMQVNAKQLNSPFEILIQGPSSNRFVRNAQQFEQKHEVVTRSASSASSLGQSPRNRRSNITIYKPGKKAKSQSTRNALQVVSKASEVVGARNKRSVDHLEWFNDFASSLVRPSPLGTRAQKQQQQSKPAAFKRQAAREEPAPFTRRDTWFLEHTAPRLTRPAPLKKKLSSRKSKETYSPRKISKAKTSMEKMRREQERDIRPFRDALQVVERIPRVLQDTVSHLSSDPHSGDVFSLNIMNEALPKDREDEVREPRRPSASFRDVRRNEIVPEAVTLAAAAPLAPTAAPFPGPAGGLFPWLRQRRLMRLQQLQGHL